MKESNEVKRVNPKVSARNLIIFIIIAVITISFIFVGGPLLGLNEFIQDLTKETIKNDDGSISIPSEAQTGQQSEKRDAYVGKVLNQKIQRGKNDEFNIQLQQIDSLKVDPFTQYYYTRQVFENAINKIIGMKKAKEMNIVISTDLLNKEVGKRYYVDADGEIDYDAMRKDLAKANEFAKQTQQNLLYENFINDFFNGLPLSKDEVFDSYKMENSKVSIKYANLSNQEIDENSVVQFFESKKDDYKMYKLTRLVFKEKKDAESNLKIILKDTSKFDEIGNKLKLDGKIVNKINDPDYSFIDDFENENFKKAVKSTEKGNVGKSIIETTIGHIIFKVDDVTTGELTDERVHSKVKNDFLAKNFQSIDVNNKKIAMEIYNEAKTNGLDKAAAKYKLKVEKTTSPVAFMQSGIPNVNVDVTDDRNYEVKVFKANKGDVLEPFKHQNGYMIAVVDEKIEVSLDEFDKNYEELYKKYSSDKSQSLASDYYISERKKYQVVDNFNYVFKLEDFMKKKEQ